MMDRNLIAKEIPLEDLELLRPLMVAMSTHHNKTTTYFKGHYPTYSQDETLKEFREGILAGEMELKGIYDGGKMIGFIAVSSKEKKGSLDWLIVDENYRGQGLGKELMEWGLERLKKREATFIDLTLVEGNPTKNFYEAYGFRTRLETMSLKIK